MVIIYKNKTKDPNMDSIAFWKRFIDGGIGLWTGTRKAFDTFINTLNEEAKPFGIHFQFGKSVNFLDLNIDDENKIQQSI